MTMNPRARFRGAMERTRIDRLPIIEWAPWWKDATIDRWYGEGLPRDLLDDISIRAYFGLDDWRQSWIRAIGDTAPQPASHGAPLIRDRQDYLALGPHLWPSPQRNLEDLAAWRDAHISGDCLVWVSLEGFFWFPRRLFGIEGHLYAFYDQPELMKEINQRLAEFHLECLEAVEKILKPDFLTFAEDLSYNNGPMLSRDQFEEFITPYYHQVLPKVRQMGAVAIIDTDGLVDPMIDWLLAAGLEGVLPLERQAGVDVCALKRRYPDLVLLGGYDKMVMPHGRQAMQGEFERILPAMNAGGFLASCDHQTPPGVSLENYRIYLDLFRDYAARAVADW